MKTAEVNNSIIGKRVKGIFDSNEVTGVVVSTYEDEYFKGVKIELDKPVFWNTHTFKNYVFAEHKNAGWGNLQSVVLLEDETNTANLNNN